MKKIKNLCGTGCTLIFMLLINVSCIDDEPVGEIYGTIDNYLTSNGITNYKTTSSGLVYIIDEPGTGALPTVGQTVSVHYTGYFLNDTPFDSSIGKSEPFSFVLGAGRVIAGWDEGIALFREGGSGTLLIPSDLAYGSRGAGSIGQNENLKFDISLEEIQ